jgi:PleD family two-component response regulator
MESNETRTLARFSQRRFRSFSEAADEVLEALAEALPGVVALGQLDPDERVHRVIEARGEGVGGLGGGATLPLAGNDIDADFLRSLGAQDWLSMPLEMSDGRIVGVLCAVDAGAGAYRPEHAAQLGVAARLLSHEWESVELRSELRRLRGRVNAGPSTDADTGLPDREGFFELLTREWRLTERGTVRSVLVVCRVGEGAGESGNGTLSAKDRLALKLAAETLAATARATDCVGRIAEMAVGAILVGCDPQDTPAFVARFLGAFERVTMGGGPEIEVSCGVQPLADASSPTEALDLAEIAADESGRSRTPDLSPQALE